HMHLYFPPHAFVRDVRITITPLTAALVPERLDNGATRVWMGDSLEWGGADLLKPGILDISYNASSDVPFGLSPLGAGGAWERSGGTVDRGRKGLSSRVSGPGRGAVFAERGRQGTEGGLAALALVPRVFSPGGRFGSRDLAISFTLGRPAPIAI